MAKRATAVVAGAGALGLSAALALADAGFAVTLADPGPPLGNASAVAGGMIAPVFEAVLDAAAAPHFDMLMAARDLWPALELRSGVAIDRTGALAAGRAEWLQIVARRIADLGLHPTDLPRRAAEDLAPGLSPTLDGVLMTREDWRLDPRAALTALRVAAETAGVVFTDRPVIGRGEADLLVLATGHAALAEIAPEIAVLSPIKGHILRARTVGLGGVTVRGEEIYVTPADDGQAVGATMEPGVGDPAPDPAKAGPLREAGARLFPALSQTPFELQAGVRAASPDGLPLVGFSDAPGVILAAGARRNGWLIAPLVGRMVAALATGADPGRFAQRFDPRRYDTP